MKQPKYLLLGVTALAIVTLSFTPIVRAEDGTTTKIDDSSTTATNTETENETGSSSGRHTEQVAERRAELQKKVQALRQEAKTHLNDARKKVCETRQDNINKIIQKRSEQGTKQLGVFTKISDRVQEFVKNKNLTVENYDGLVSAINDKEAAAQAAIDANSGVTFSCDTTSADKPAQVPRTTIEAVRTALKDYRTAIKNLIVNVKASAEKTEATTSGEVTQ